MNIGLALGTTLAFTFLFNWLLRYADKQEKLERFEPKLVTIKLGLKLKPKQKKQVIKWSNIYYTLLFFIAALISFYITNMVMLILIILGMFMVGLYLGIILLKIFAKKITK